jgi:hypothetical protein
MGYYSINFVRDMAGDENLSGVGIAFFRGADGVIFVFDLTSEESFEKIPKCIFE